MRVSEEERSVRGGVYTVQKGKPYAGPESLIALKAAQLWTRRPIYTLTGACVDSSGSEQATHMAT